MNAKLFGQSRGVQVIASPEGVESMSTDALKNLFTPFSGRGVVPHIPVITFYDDTGLEVAKIEWQGDYLVGDTKNPSNGFLFTRADGHTKKLARANTLLSGQEDGFDQSNPASVLDYRTCIASGIEGALVELGVKTNVTRGTQKAAEREAKIKSDATLEALRGLCTSLKIKFSEDDTADTLTQKIVKKQTRGGAGAG